MVKVSILYPARLGARFDVEYYLNTHMPMSARLLGPAIKAIAVDIGRPGPGPEDTAPFVAMCAFICETVEDFMQAFTPVAAELQGDIPRYTDIQPIVQFSDIRMG